MSTTTIAPSVDEGLKTVFLLEKAKHGSQEAWEVLYRRYRTLLVVRIRLRISSRARRRFDAEDVLQSAFLSAWSDIRSFRYQGEDSFRRWLSRIVINRVNDKLRRQAKEVQVMKIETQAMADAAEQVSIDKRLQPSEIAEHNERYANTLVAMARLDEDDQDVLTMRIFEKLSWERIAEILGCSRKLVRKRYDLAVERLSKVEVD